MGQSVRVEHSHCADFAALLEIDFVEAPEIRGEVIAGATNRAAITSARWRLGFILRRFAKSVGLQLGMIGELIFLQNFYFVVPRNLLVQVGDLVQALRR